MAEQIIRFSKNDETSLFDGADSATLATVDIPASIARFETVLAARIADAYPEADVDSDGRYWASGFGDDDSNVAYTVRILAEDLFNDGNAWMVEAPAWPMTS